MFEIEVLKMLEQYDMSVHFRGMKLERVEGTDVTPVGVAAVQQTNRFLVTILN
jgi:hypothetical protein